MRKKLSKPGAQIRSSNKINYNGITAFKQHPAENQFPIHDAKTGKDDSVTDLFSRFTADIIKKDVIFTR